MVDPKETKERSVETEDGFGQAARKVWTKPRLETYDVADDTGFGTLTHHDGGAPGSCLS